MSRRAEIVLTEAEQLELLRSERVVVVSTNGPRGWPHSMPMWFVLREAEIWIWTYAKSQKVRNLERDPRATLLVETGRSTSSCAVSRSRRTRRSSATPTRCSSSARS